MEPWVLKNTCHNQMTNFLNEEEKFKYIDDLSMLELVNLISIGIANDNFKANVASDIGIGHKYLPPENVPLQNYIQQD